MSKSKSSCRSFTILSSLKSSFEMCSDLDFYDAAFDPRRQTTNCSVRFMQILRINFFVVVFFWSLKTNT